MFHLFHKKFTKEDKTFIALGMALLALPMIPEIFSFKPAVAAPYRYEQRCVIGENGLSQCKPADREKRFTQFNKAKTSTNAMARKAYTR